MMAKDILMRSLTVLIILSLKIVTSSGKSDVELLLEFKASMINTEKLSNWNVSTPLCSSEDGKTKGWIGLHCAKGKMWGIGLENMGLKGTINVDVLDKIVDLKSISLMFNEFEGPLPQINKLTHIKTMYLSNNKFSGVIPSNLFQDMASLKKLHLSDNKFTGPIPASLGTLPKLVELTLDNNGFEGPIPNFTEPRWTLFNVANNKLEGPIPANLNQLEKSSFAGNKDLCGAPLEKCSTGLPVLTIVIIVVAVVAALIIIILIIIVSKNRNTNSEETRNLQSPRKIGSADLENMEKGSSSPDRSGRGSSNGKKSDSSVKLSFLRDDRTNFDMTDLLKASAEVLGSGVFGSTYKAVLEEKGVMVVKRYKKMNSVDREEFTEHMTRLGNLSHTNLLPLVAYYYRKEEKLLLSDLAVNGSLAAHLHGKKSGSHDKLDWATRLKIVKGVVRGMTYLYNELPITAPCGHLKSSNVLLNATFEPMLADYGLLPIVNTKHAQQHMIVYKAPEYIINGKIDKKSDVWSLGILILEILTGKYPPVSSVDLSTWVDSIASEGVTPHMFDKEMTRTKGSEGEIMKLLEIGLTCCEANVSKRMDISEVVEKIEEVKERDNMDDDFYSVYTSEGDMRSSRGLSEDFTHIAS